MASWSCLVTEKSKTELAKFDNHNNLLGQCSRTWNQNPESKIRICSPFVIDIIYSRLDTYVKILENDLCPCVFEACTVIKLGMMPKFKQC
ncbi:hypothetical protein LXL04_004601 [Taraxacum kok-saghyz]